MPDVSEVYPAINQQLVNMHGCVNTSNILSTKFANADMDKTSMIFQQQSVYSYNNIIL